MTQRVALIGITLALCLPGSSMGAGSRVAEGSAPAVARGTLTFEQRVAAQEAVERARLRVAGAPARQLSHEKLHAAAVDTVEKYLGETVALERLWGVTITAEMLQRETQRIFRESKLPDRLLGILRALDDDAFTFEECVSRPTLVRRLIGAHYAFDPRIHAEARRRAERVRDEVVSGRVPRAMGDRGWSELLVVREGVRKPEDRAIPGEVIVERDELARLRRRTFMEGRPRADFEETRDGFAVRYPLQDAADGLHLLSVYIPKDALESWWRRESTRFVRREIPPVAAPTQSLAALRPRRIGAAPCQDDVWRPSAIDGPPDPRARHSSIWTGTELIVWGGTFGNTFETLLNSGARYDPVIDDWMPISRVGAPSARADHTAVWTGTEMIVWGGRGVGYQGKGDGARYDPANDTWSPLGASQAPTPRYGHSAVWSGAEMIVWGGTGGLGYDEAQGARYDPIADSWMPLPLEGSPSPRTRQTAVWSGSEMIVWGGQTYTSQLLGDGARYDPIGDVWNAVSAEGAPFMRTGHTAVWTGSEMIVWGGRAPGFTLHEGAAYDPSQDAWSVITDAGENNARMNHAAVWAGDRMIVIGGDPIYSRYNGYAQAYVPETGSWVFVPNPPSALGRTFTTAVWTGQDMIIWGGEGGGNRGGRFNLEGQSWLMMSVNDAPLPREGGTSVWTGSELLLWGGEPVLYDNSSWAGDRYDALLGAWSGISPEEAPERRANHVAVWTGTEMVIWGGRSLQTQGVRLNNGGRYDPSTDTWRPTALVSAPAARTSAVAVWSGSEMIVWGGFANGATATGGRYDPAADVWRQVGLNGAPEIRFFPGAVWAAGRMVLWGGANASFEYPVTGARYDPTTDSWAPTTTLGAPGGRRTHAMVAAGDRVVVWGGSTDTAVLGSGGIYDPAADRWSPMSSTGAPTARLAASSVWTGDEFIVWGGLNSLDASPYTGTLDTGGRYDPLTDSWRAMATLGAPLARYRATSAWTGSDMIVWGGDSAQWPLNSGGTYVACRAIAPVADAGEDLALECAGAFGAVATLDASASSGDIDSFEWIEDLGTPTETVLGSGETLEQAFSLGIHHVTLKVTDRNGAVDTDDVVITVADTHDPKVTCPAPVQVECQAAGHAYVSLPSATATDVCGGATLSNDRTLGGADGSGVYALGATTVTFTATDGAGHSASCKTAVTVADTIPPSVTVAPAPQSLWPPNHGLNAVHASVSSVDACDSSPQVVLESVVSSEPDDAPGGSDGSTTEDVQLASPGTADFDVVLRAERSGDGPGRVYTIRYRATDATGNTGFGTGAVAVPHDQSQIVDPVHLRVDGASSSIVSWEPIGSAQHFDVIRGRLDELREAGSNYNLGAVACLGTNVTSTSAVDAAGTTNPAPGHGFFYLVQFHDVFSESTYGEPSSEKARVPGTGSEPCH